MLEEIVDKPSTIADKPLSTMNVKTSKRISFYTQSQQFAARVLLIVWLLVSYIPGDALATQGVLRLSKTAIVGILALPGSRRVSSLNTLEDPVARRSLEADPSVHLDLDKCCDAYHRLLDSLDSNRLRELDITLNVRDPNNNKACLEQCRKLSLTNGKVDMPKDDFPAVTEAIGDVLEACPLAINDDLLSLSIAILHQGESSQLKISITVITQWEKISDENWYGMHCVKNFAAPSKKLSHSIPYYA